MAFDDNTASFERSALLPLPFWARYSLPLRVAFPVANVSRDVAHGLRVVPDGMLVIRADANIKAVLGKAWTDNVAYLQADVANAHATIIFLTTREAARDV